MLRKLYLCFKIVIFLPPYSPDLNPIELTFSYIKQYLQEHQMVIQALKNVSDIIKSAFNSIFTVLD